MKKEKWWGEIEIPKDNTLLFNLGDVSLTVQHKAKEWCFNVEQKEYDENNQNIYNQTVYQTSDADQLDNKGTDRYIIPDEATHLKMTPILPDRTIICRPITPITLAPGASVLMYISTPLWLTLSVIGKKTTLLTEISTQRLSDTWFGTSTREGELCYANKINGRLDLNNLPKRIQRSITPLTIINKAHHSLVFERVALPITSLSLYATEQNQLWTQAVTLTRDDDKNYAKLTLGKAPENCHLINGPRNSSRHEDIFRAFSAIFN